MAKHCDIFQTFEVLAKRDTSYTPSVPD